MRNSRFRSNSSHYSDKDTKLSVYRVLIGHRPPFYQLFCKKGKLTHPLHQVEDLSKYISLFFYPEYRLTIIMLRPNIALTHCNSRTPIKSR